MDKTSLNQFTPHGQALSKLPDFSSLAMSKAVLAALCDYDCGYDLICLSAILGVLNTTVLFKSIPDQLKSSDGDFMTLLNIMNEVLLVRQSCSPQQIDLDQVCQARGLAEIRHVIRQAFRRYTNLEKTFKQSPEYRQKARINSGRGESIARALLAGYSENVFVSLKQLQNRSLHFIRYDGSGDVAILDLQSTLTRPISKDPVALVLARDIRHSTAIRATAILSFVGEIKDDWIKHSISRQLKITNDEEQFLKQSNRYADAESKFFGIVSMSLSSSQIS